MSTITHITKERLKIKVISVEEKIIKYTTEYNPNSICIITHKDFNSLYEKMSNNEYIAIKNYESSDVEFLENIVNFINHIGAKMSLKNELFQQLYNKI